MKFIGVDLAARSKKTSVCVLDWKTTPRVEAIYGPASDECILHATGDDVAAVGIDSPFGWPAPFVSFVQPDQSSRRPCPLSDAEADELKYRSTDLWVRDHFRRRGKSVRPLSVATDKLGAVALRCVRLVQCLTADHGGHSAIYEVYPAASLHHWLPLDSSYKSRSNVKCAAKSKAVRKCIIERLEQYVDISACGERLVDNDDDLDALVSALTAALAFQGRTHPPPPQLADLAYSEGWIHIPSGPLCDLALLAFAA